jgi:hypothetical protein
MNFIYEVKNSIPDDLCDDIITMYELEDDKYQGLVIAGILKEIKDTTDLLIPKNDKSWEKIEKYLYNALNKGFTEYCDFLNKKEYNTKNRKYNVLEFNDFHVEHFMIQKYKKCEGIYVYHNDFSINTDLMRYRAVTFLWYLNTIEEGGETEFWGNYEVKPEKGKLIFFPASWAYPHRGKMPISSDKYIITNWFYVKESTV